MGNTFNFDEGSLQREIQPKLDQMQAELTRTMQETVREVRDEMSGQPAEQVYAELIRRLDERIPGLNHNEENLRAVAAAIEAGTLTG